MNRLHNSTYFSLEIAWTDRNKLSNSSSFHILRANSRCMWQRALQWCLQMHLTILGDSLLDMLYCVKSISFMSKAIKCLRKWRIVLEVSKTGTFTFLRKIEQYSKAAILAFLYQNQGKCDVILQRVFGKANRALGDGRPCTLLFI